DRPRPAAASFAGATHGFALPPDLTQRLKAFAKTQNATLFMVLMAAFQTLLARWSGQNDIVTGTPIANRTRRETEGLIGFFVNPMALRTRLDDDPSFRTLVGRVRETALGAYAHQDLPFEKVVEALNPPRDLSRQPVFQVMFTLQNAQASALTLPGLELSLIET